MRKLFLTIVSAAALLMAACTGDSDRPEATGEGLVRAINTIPTGPEFGFLIEERTIGGANYASATTQTSFDDLEYNFNFQVALPGLIGAQRVATVPQKIERDRAYTFLITGDVAAPDIIVWDYPVTEFAETDTTFELRFGHTAESYGPIDVYYAPPGTAPVAGEAVASLEFGEVSDAVVRESGEYVYIMTTAGDPGDILFESNTTTGSSRTSLTITPFDGTANDPGPLAVRVISQNGTSSALADTNIDSTVRFIHASMALATSDIYSDEALSDRIVANHAYKDITGDLDLDFGEYTFTYTTAGNTGSILFEAPAVLFPASRVEVYIVGEVDALSANVVNPDRRSVETLTKLKFTHAAFNHPFVDLYIVEAGTSLEDVLLPEFFGIPPGLPPLSTTIDQGNLEMYVTVAGEKTIIAGPVALTAELGDVFDYIAYDTVDPATADLVQIPAP